MKFKKHAFLIYWSILLSAAVGLTTVAGYVANGYSNELEILESKYAQAEATIQQLSAQLSEAQKKLESVPPTPDHTEEISQLNATIAQFEDTRVRRVASVESIKSARKHVQNGAFTNAKAEIAKVEHNLISTLEREVLEHYTNLANQKRKK